MRCPKSRFSIQIIEFDELELIIFVSQGLTLSTASLVCRVNVLTTGDVYLDTVSLSTWDSEELIYFEIERNVFIIAQVSLESSTMKFLLLPSSSHHLKAHIC